MSGNGLASVVIRATRQSDRYRSARAAAATAGGGAGSIWSFENGGSREWYIGSADLMDRNLDRRVEAVVPVEDHDAGIRLAGIIDLMLSDDRRSWQLQPDSTWVRTEVLEGVSGTIDTFEALKEDALTRGEVLHVPHRPGAGAGSLDPRA